MSHAENASSRSWRGAAGATCALLAAGLIAVLPTAMAPAAAEAAPEPVIVPKQGKVVRSHLVLIRVRAGDRSEVLDASLNGVPIGEDFGRSRKGVRRFEASVSEGLQRGKNRLSVRVRRYGKRPLRQRTTFYVRGRGRILVGAGRNRLAAVGTPMQVRGKLQQGDASKLRWRLIRGPRHMEAEGLGPPLSSKSGIGARLAPPVTGRYVLELAHGKRRSAIADRVRVDVVPPKPMVTFDTDFQEGFPVIQVGDQTYDGGLEIDNAYQVLVLNRKTTGLISNKMIDSSEDLGTYIDTLAKGGDGKLVIVAAHRPTPALSAPAKLLEPIGIPALDSLPKGGRFVAIGVPGMEPGAGDWSEGGGFTGYLMPDQYRNYGPVSPVRHEFSYGGQDVGNGHIGYRVQTFRGLGLDPTGDTYFDTNGPGLTPSQQDAEAQKMTATLVAAEEGDVVVVRAVSSRAGGEPAYPVPIGSVSKTSMDKLANAISKLGGTRNGFNRAATVSGTPASNGAVYTLVGYPGAKEGEGAEAAAGVAGVGDVPMLSGVIRPDHDGLLKTEEDVPGATGPNAFAELVLDPKTEPWPLADDPGAIAALGWLASQDQTLGPDPRTAYWTQELDTDALITKLGAISYPSGQAFTAADFEAAKAQLLLELGYVGKVRDYLGQLAQPFSTQGMVSWSTAKTIADAVYQDANANATIGVNWLEIISSILGLIPVFGPEETAAVHAAETFSRVWDFGVTVFGAVSEGGEPSDAEIQVEADQLGKGLVDQAQQGQVTLKRIGDVIVSDWAKLSELGPVAACNVQSPGCPEKWSYSAADGDAASANAYLGVERVSYLKLLPLGFRPHSLARQNYTGKRVVHPDPPDPVNYYCNSAYPWSNYPDLARSSASMLSTLDPAGSPRDNEWDTFVLSRPPGNNDYHGTPPSKRLLDRMFNPLSESGDPTVGGIGLDWTQFALPELREDPTDREYWEGSAGVESAVCGWSK